jgi:hypothetical protein
MTAASPAKDLKPKNSLTSMGNNDEQTRVRENYLLSKSNSTSHIPDDVRNKNAKRVYAIFDKEIAGKMFGYRVLFSKRKMDKVPESDAAPLSKPLSRCVNDIMGELS